MGDASRNEELVRVFWDVCWNQRRIDQLAEVFHDPFILGAIEGPRARLVEIVKESVAASSDCNIEVRSLHTFGDAVVTRTLISGTHTGVVFGVPPTGRAYRVPMLDVFAFRDGKVYHYMHLADHLAQAAAMDPDLVIAGVKANFN